MRAFAPLAWRVVLLLATAGCTHDLDALRTPSGGTGGPAGGGGTTGGGGTGAPDAGAVGDGGMAEADAAAAQDVCMPCEPLPNLADQVGLSSCCFGAGNLQCGVTSGAVSACFSPTIEGRDDPACPNVQVAMDVELTGCCRPDAYCGFSLGSIGFGCVRRDQVPAPSAASRDPIMCRYECNGDLACRAIPNHICVEAEDDDEPTTRFCARACEYDGDCEDGLVCAITNNDFVDRVDAYCQGPIGPLGPGSPCDSPTDCIHGLCAGLPGGDSNTCAELCSDPSDCPSDRPVCFIGQILKPSRRDTPPDQTEPSDFQSFGICAPAMN